MIRMERAEAWNRDMTAFTMGVRLIEADLEVAHALKDAGIDLSRIRRFNAARVVPSVLLLSAKSLKQYEEAIEAELRAALGEAIVKEFS
jgi:hypothetical protein